MSSPLWREAARMRLDSMMSGASAEEEVVLQTLKLLTAYGCASVWLHQNARFQRRCQPFSIYMHNPCIRQNRKTIPLCATYPELSYR